MDAPRVLVAIEPGMYAEGLASLLGAHRPRAEVTILDPSEDVEAGALRVRPHLVVAHRVPPGARVGAFWVEVARAVGGGGPRPWRRRSRPTGTPGASPTSASSTCSRRSTGPRSSSSSGWGTPKTGLRAGGS